MNDDFIEEGEATTSTEQRAVKRVRDDFSRAESYLRNFHKQCIERYKHYVAPGLESNPNKDSLFPVPFTTEQIDTLTADMMEKLWYKDEPCSIYGRNDTDKDDANAKREFMSYQDDVDDIHAKTRQAIINAAIYKMAPAVVNYREDYEIVNELQEVPLLNSETNTPIYDVDGQTPLMTQQEIPTQKYTYQGASVDLIDPIDFFWTPEKRYIYDEHPLMIRQRRSIQWFKDKPYISEQGIKKLVAKWKSGSDEEYNDLLNERRAVLGYSQDEPGWDKQYSYVEWQGYFDVEGNGEKELYIIGVAEGDCLMRFELGKDVFDLGHPNIVVGVIGQEFGEIYGLSLIDKFHSVQHGMDSLMGIWLKNLRQTGNNMWIGQSSKMVTKKLKNDAGFFIDCLDDPNKVVKRVEPQQISQDVYAGLQMFRDMGQNATGLNDISSGVVQEGVETLGEANILAGQTALRTKGGYLRSFEKSFIEPLWKMRNHINIKFCTDPGYMYTVLEDNVVYWRQLEPLRVRSEVDFVCEASARENQRGVVTQQILQAVNLNIKMGDILGPVPLIKLLEMLYEEGFGWKHDKIRELLPLEAIAQNLIQKQMAEQQAQQAQMQGENPQNMPQPMTEGDAIQSANAQMATPVGEIG